MDSDYIYLRNEDPGDEEFLYIVVCQPTDQSLLYFENSEIGLPDHWKEELTGYPTGYYKIEYTWERDTESLDGFEIASYQILGDITSIKNSPLAAPLLWFFHYRAVPVFEFAVDLFSKVWAVDCYWGPGGGFVKSGMYLHQAILYKYFGYKKDDPHCTARILRRSFY